MSSRLLRLVLTSPHSLEDVFMARYERLRGWALHLSDHDPAAADDLLQEAFVQFTATNTDLDSIENLDAYLFGLVRILHLSQLRRTRRRARLLDSVLDYNAAVLGLRHADPHDQLAVRDELRRVCQYGCARKETSKAGSVLLLRFFLGYYPGEIARVTKSTRAAVEERLRVARAEAKAYLSDRSSLNLIGVSPAVEPPPARGLDPSEPPDAFLKDIRRHIALSKRGECLTEETIRHLYDGDATVDCATLAHLVSCDGCLDSANRLLGLAPLAERHPVDTAGKDTGSGGGGAAGGGGGESADPDLTRGRRRAREVFEHDPGELCVAVNGDHLCSQTVGGGRNEQTLNVERQVEFVEVFSEQGVRMLLLVVGGQPPDGPVRHAARTALSDGRSLEVALELNYPFSTLRVVYEDRLRPWRNAAEVPERESDGIKVATSPAELTGGEHATREARREPAAASVWQRLVRLFSGGPRWLRPGVVTAILSLLLVGALLFVRTRVGTVSAAELLSRSAVAERAAASDRATVTHRTLYLEQRDAAGRESSRRQRIEVWHSEARRVTVRKVYDEAGGFVIGERVTAEGERTVLLPDAKPAAVREAKPAAAALLAAGAAWRLNPSAVDYLDLTGGAAFASVEDGGESYVVRDAGRADAGVVEAVLTLRKADLHAVEMRLVYASDAGRREYKFVEELFERPPPERTPPKLFEADGDATGAGVVPDASDKGATYAPAPAAPVRASAELEVEVNYLLHPLGTNPGEQVSVRRTPDERLRVEALVETPERKQEILAALRPVAGNPAVLIDVSTVAESLAARGQRSPGPVTDLDVRVRDDARETDAELASKLAGADAGDGRAREEVARVGERLLADSRQAVRHSAALIRLTANFPSRADGGLDAAAREKLREMIRAHAEACLRNARAIRQGLAPFSTPAPRGASEAALIKSDADAARAAERLARLTRETDDALSAAFTLSQTGQSLAPIKSARFWDSLGAAEELSLAILQAYR
ncbi:MAG TPA: sigma-70 family RNA polymerase sigma factor [Pyrinomonadaceae bacterium]|nr:sigma-70 family RNA polymerase sigma factor [Pyrinomonadaceae bacterium]